MQMGDATLGAIILVVLKTIAGFALIAAFGALYFLPAIVGRKKRNSQAIVILNIFFGWTFVGWVVALVWAVTKDPDADTAR